MVVGSWEFVVVLGFSFISDIGDISGKTLTADYANGADRIISRQRSAVGS